MKFKGEHKDVVLRGIELAGSDRAVAAGGMNELIGLVERDGMLEPYGLTQEFSRVLPTGCKRIMVHKTSMGDNALCLYTSGNIQWMPYSDFSGNTYNASNWQDTGLTGVEEIALVGNMITDQNLHSVLFRSDGYVPIETEVDSSMLPNMQLRVRCDYDFEANEQRAEYGTGNRIVSIRNYDETGITYNQYGIVTGYVTSSINDENIKETIAGHAQKCFGRWAEKGGLTGYVMAVVAYRLTNGEYVAAGMPILLGAPYVKYRDGGTRVEYNLTETLYDASGGIEIHPSSPNDQDYNIYGDDVVYLPDDLYEKSTNDDYIGFQQKTFPPSQSSADIAFIGDKNSFVKKNGTDSESYMSKYYEHGIYAFYPDPFYSSTPPADSEYYANRPSPALYGFYDALNSNPRAGAVARANILEYKLDSSIGSGFETSIGSVCIFLSKQVNPYKHFNKQNVRWTEKITYRRYDDPNTDGTRDGRIRGFYFYQKTDEEIVNELKECNTFYKVKEIPFSEIQSGGWIKVDLEGKLGDTLLTLPTLPPSAFSNTKTFSGKLFTYNNRVHIFDYKQSPSLLNNIKPFIYRSGYGQWNRTVNAVAPGSGYPRWRIIAKCKSGEHGSYVLDSGGIFTRQEQLLELITYPNTDCYEMDLRIEQNGTIYRKVLNMAEWTGQSLSVCWPTLLKPLSWTDDFETYTSSDSFYTGAMVVGTNNTTFSYRNRMKASEAAFPFFPPEQTYPIGKSAIIGMAHMAVGVGQDAYGRNPILALCDDGIYTLGVDETGKRAYSNTNFLSPEVTLNRKSICMLGGAVLFVSRRGLMICTDKGADNFITQTIGTFRHLPRSTTDMGSGLTYYYNALHHTTLSNNYAVVDGVPFETFIRHADTETNLLSTKQSIMLYNPNYPYSYLIDVKSRKLSKIPKQLLKDDDNYPEQMFYDGSAFLSAGLHSGEDNTMCIFQTRPMYLGGVLKSAFRFLLRGDFRGDPNYKAGFYVLGSLDGEHWKLMGGKEKALSAAGFHDFGCETYRDEVAYLMAVFVGYLHKSSHIDRMETDGMF